MEKAWAAAVALMALLVITGCESEAPPQLAVRTLARVGSPSGKFEAVLKRIDPGAETPMGYIYQLHVITTGADADSDPAVELRHLDLQTPVELEWTGETKLTLTYGAADVSGHKEFVKVADKDGKPEQVEVVLKGAE